MLLARAAAAAGFLLLTTRRARRNHPRQLGHGRVATRCVWTIMSRPPPCSSCSRPPPNRRAHTAAPCTLTLPVTLLCGGPGCTLSCPPRVAGCPTRHRSLTVLALRRAPPRASASLARLFAIPEPVYTTASIGVFTWGAEQAPPNVVLFGCRLDTTRSSRGGGGAALRGCAQLISERAGSFVGARSDDVMPPTHRQGVPNVLL